MNEESQDRGLLPSASSIDRLAHCAASAQRERGLPDLPQDDVTQSGTDIHAAIASGEDEELKLTDKEVKERLVALEKFALDEWMEKLNVQEVDHPVREKRLWIRNKQTLQKVSSAQLDVYYRGRTSFQTATVLAIDFKSGYAETTPSERSWQLRTQALAVWHEFPDVNHVMVGIASSRLFSKLDTAVYDLPTLNHSQAALEQLLWRAAQPDAEAVPGSWCRYCKARGTCPEAAVFATLATRNIPIKAKVDQLAVVEAVKLMTPEQLGLVYPRKAVAEKIFEAIGDRLRALSEEDLKRAGYQIKPGVMRKEITNVAAAWQIVFDLLGHAEALKCITIVRGRIAEAIAERDGLSSEKAKARVDAALESVLVENEGKKRLVKL